MYNSSKRCRGLWTNLPGERHRKPVQAPLCRSKPSTFDFDWTAVWFSNPRPRRYNPAMPTLSRALVRLRRGVSYSAVLAAATADPARRRLMREAAGLARELPGRLDQPLPAAMQALTPVPSEQPLDVQTIRQIVDALTAFGAGRPLGICLRRSLLRYHFLRRAGLPVVVHFGARRLGEGIGGHAWLTLNGQPYHEQPEHYREYLVMYSYPPAITPEP